MAAVVGQQVGLISYAPILNGSDHLTRGAEHANQATLEKCYWSQSNRRSSERQIMQRTMSPFQESIMKP